MQSVQAQAHECERAYRNSRPALPADEDGVCGSVRASVFFDVQSVQESYPAKARREMLNDDRAPGTAPGRNAENSSIQAALTSPCLRLRLRRGKAIPLADS